jgi:metallo-beta-lactamase class B
MYTNTAFVLASVISLAVAAPSQGPPLPSPWTTRTPPVRIIDNVYWVGRVDLASYLITTPEGHILIDTGVPENADAVAESIAALGFKLRDVRIKKQTGTHPAASGDSLVRNPR